MLEPGVLLLKAQCFSFPQSPLPQIRIIQSQQWFNHICGVAGWLLNDAQKHCALI